jgi:hypothetical protein
VDALTESKELANVGKMARIAQSSDAETIS